jgi:hypothetical protein
VSVPWKLIAALTLATLAAIRQAQPAAADGFDGEAAGDTIGAEVSTGREGAGGGSGGSGGPACTYDEAAGLVDEVVKQIDGVWYVMYWRMCGSAMTAVWIPELDGEDLAELAIDEVRRKLPVPATRLAPAPEQLVTQLSTWIWTDPAIWQPVTATAALPTLSATVTARPMVLRFDPGDGRHGTGAITCLGPGQPWLPEFGDDRVSPCSYTYRHSSDLSATGTWTTSTTIDWAVTYQVSDGSSGDLAALTTRSTLPVTVGELQALLTGRG